jgi:hypothetical protein
MLMALLAATPPRLFKLVALSLGLPTALAVAVNFLSELFLGPVDTLVALAVVIARLRGRDTASQQPYS